MDISNPKATHKDLLKSHIEHHAEHHKTEEELKEIIEQLTNACESVINAPSSVDTIRKVESAIKKAKNTL